MYVIAVNKAQEFLLSRLLYICFRRRRRCLLFTSTRRIFFDHDAMDSTRVDVFFDDVVHYYRPTLSANISQKVWPSAICPPTSHAILWLMSPVGESGHNDGSCGSALHAGRLTP